MANFELSSFFSDELQLMCLCMQTHSHMHMHTHVCMQAHVRVHTHMHICTHNLLQIHMAKLSHNDISWHDNSSIESNILWCQLLPHKEHNSLVRMTFIMTQNTRWFKYDRD